jgi:hypothetical protein
MALRPVPGNGPSPQLACGTTNEHDVVTGWVERPVVSFAGVIVRPGDLHKALVEREVVPDGVLPALLVLPIVWKVLHDVIIDATQRQLPLLAGPDGHHDESVVGEWWLLVFTRFLVSRLHIISFFFACLPSWTLCISIAGG